jgi:hypothetical protein
MPDQPGGHSHLAVEAASLAAHAADPARYGLVIERRITDERPEMYCFDTAEPIVTGQPPGQLGHGGQVFAVAFNSGTRVVTNNLWHLGEVPAWFDYKVSPNASLYAYPRGFRYEVTYADGSHNLAMVTESSAEAAFATASRMSAGGDQVDVAHAPAGGERCLIASFAGGLALPAGAARMPGPADFPAPVAAALSPLRAATGTAGRPGMLRRGRPQTVRSAQASAGVAWLRLR